MSPASAAPDSTNCAACATFCTNAEPGERQRRRGRPCGGPPPPRHHKERARDCHGHLRTSGRVSARSPSSITSKGALPGAQSTLSLTIIELRRSDALAGRRQVLHQPGVRRERDRKARHSESAPSGCPKPRIVATVTPAFFFTTPPPAPATHPEDQPPRRCANQQRSPSGGDLRKAQPSRGGAAAAEALGHPVARGGRRHIMKMPGRPRPLSHA